MNFWDGMELWEKLLVLLTCGIICVLFAGVGRILYTKFRVKKFSKLAEARRSHLENMRDSRNVIDLKPEDVPFGIRAIEAGIEVEGVVISRPPTPTRVSYNHSQTTLVASDADSMKSRGQGPPSPRSVYGSNAAPPPMKQLGRGSGPMVHQPSPHQSLHPPAPQANSRTPSVRSSDSSLVSTAAPSLTNVPSRGELGAGSRALSEPIGRGDLLLAGANTDGTTTPGGISSTSTSIPDTLARLEGRMPPPTADNPKSSGPFKFRPKSRTPSPPEGPGSPALPSVNENKISESSSRESDSGAEGPLRYSRPSLVSAFSSPSISANRHASQALPETTQGDLSLLHEHRLSHAAEVGQLLPRRRETIRHSRTVIGGPMPESLTEEYFSPVASERVYALDIAIPNSMPGIDGLRFPPTAAVAGSSVTEERPRSASDLEKNLGNDLPMFDGPWLTRSGDDEKSKGVLKPDNQFSLAPEEAKAPLRVDPLYASEPPEPKSKPKKLQKRKKQGSPNRDSAAVMDLEAQR